MSAPPEAPYAKSNTENITADVVNAASQGQTLYIRQITRTFLHKWSLFVNALVILSCINLAIGQVLALFLKFNSIMEIVVRAYTIMICLMISMNELAVESVLQRSPILQLFHWRGLFYTFIGSLADMMSDVGMDNRNRYNYNYNNNYNNDGYWTFQVPSYESAVEWYISFDAWFLFSAGCLYFVMGGFFLQRYIDRDIDEYRRRLQVSDAELAGHQDVLQSRVGGRFAEEVGMGI
jgi:hypothetical protein